MFLIDYLLEKLQDIHLFNLKKMNFIPLANILNISIIILMMIIFFNNSSAKKSTLLFQYVNAYDKNYDDYFNRSKEINEMKLTVFEFYVTKYNLDVKRILISISDESLKKKLDKIDNYCKHPGEYNEEKFLKALQESHSPDVANQNRIAQKPKSYIEQSESALKDYTDSVTESLSDYRDPVVETKNYCLRTFIELYQNLMICLTKICTDENSCIIPPKNELVTTVPKLIRITLKNTLNNQDENADATPRNYNISSKVKSFLLKLDERDKLSKPNEKLFYGCIQDFKNGMIRLNTKITRNYNKELITLQEKIEDQTAFPINEKKKILQFQEIALLKALSIISDGKIKPTFIPLWFSSKY
ncbi:uncharacterized protein LOC114132624 isoform X5 [Aphis gossypii]|uniref:uncharacterized protein LOC114132624 isoform X4 n=1 Tax=Aphis gossypii TaxID=80765 RepID=UPI0021590FF6|nr:uncharacterized protein LOC114132624 isoform X4 [Aphis gossypii]XP_050056464.1 uncharacterized protein LOC114132624 isoform X5 [Aphis gossypii]